MKSDHLYTWTDVQHEIYTEISEKNCPNGLIHVRVFWDGVHILARANREEDSIKWLEKLFGTRFKRDQDEVRIILDHLRKKERYLEVYIEVEDEEDKDESFDEALYFRPLLAKPTIITPKSFKNEPPDISDNYPPIYAFHSFKGGVGRTVHALACALSAASDYKVLLVDADLEAPGITWILEQRKPKLDISFADMLAMIHSDSEDESDESLELIQDRIKNIYLEKMFIMPAFRSSAQFASLEIRPEHLIKYSDNPYILTEMLGKVGKKLDADAVIVDLRAGLSEISAGLLLDPRVHRIFVTTLSDQSLTGTCHELEYIGKLAHASKDYMPLPNIILSMIPQQYRREREKMNDVRKRIENASAHFFPKHDGSVKNNGTVRYASSPPIYETAFDQELLVLPKDWDEIVPLIRQSKIIEEVRPIFKYLEKKRRVRTMEFISVNAILDDTTIQEKQKNALEYISRILESRHLSADDFYITDAMRRLAYDFANKVPIAIIRGKKHSGKTTFFNYLVQNKSWNTVVKRFAPDIDFEFDAAIIPVYIPLGDRAKSGEDGEFIQAIWKKFEQEDFSKNEEESGNSWTDYFAWSYGYGYDGIGNIGDVLEDLSSDEQHLIFVSDLPSLRHIGEPLKPRFKELIRSVPKWFETHHLRALGLILFCDADFSDDLEAFEPYLPYQLKMTQADALRYAFFLLKKAEFSMTKMPSYKLRLNELTEIEANLKENGDALTGYQFNTFFSLYKKDITPYTILSFFQSLFKMLLSDKDKRRKIDDELLATAMTEAIIKEE